MTAENQNEESANEGPDLRNLSIDGSADESIVVVGDQNTVKQGPSYYTINRFGFFKTEKSPARLNHLRKPLLKQMKTDVAQRLEDSLHNLIRVDLEQEEQRYQVGRRKKEHLVKVTSTSTQASHGLMQRELAVSNNNEAREAIPPAEQTYNIFHRSDIGGRLLILGEPGAGKTTELMMIAQRLVEAAIKDNDQPIPIIFELSSWEPNTPILTWLGQQLQKSYGVSKKLAEPLATQWMQQTQILPLLDGLDELGQQNQVACIKALEDFLVLHPALSVLICCRREEYEQGEAQLKQLNGAVYLQAVGLQQIQQYLTDLGREQLWEGIQASSELLTLAQSPLFLTMLVIAYQGKPIRDKSSLFNAYIQKQLHEPSHQGTYKLGKEKSSEQTLHYLGWLAGQLQKRNTTEFLIEDLQPDWLSLKQRRQIYGLSVVLIIGLILVLWGMLAGADLSTLLWIGLNGLVVVAFLDKIAPKEQIKWSFRQGLGSALRWGLFGTLSGVLIFGLLGALDGSLSGAMSGAIRSGGLDGSQGGMLNGAIDGALWGALDGTKGGALWGARWLSQAGALGGAINGGVSNKAIAQKQIPNQGIQKSLQNGFVFGLIGALLFGWIGALLFDLIGAPSGSIINVLIGALGVGLISALFFGLFSGIQHFILRICLTKTGDIPWNYAKFLDYSTRHRFIQRTGGRYRFVHDLLRQHFAQMTPEQQADLAQPTSRNRP